MKLKNTFGSFGKLLVGLMLLQVSVAEAQVQKELIDRTQPKLVKIYGSGGFANLHSYQTGILVTDDGKVLTAWSHVLDGKTTVVDFVGVRYEAKFLGMDPITELALLKIDASNRAHFPVKKQGKIRAGQGVVAFSNLFGIATKNEQVSVMSGIVSAISKLDASSGQFSSPYQGEIIVLDLITNNPGAAGGAIVDLKGNLVGIIGKELKDRQTGAWLNFCIPTDTVNKTIKNIESGGNRVTPDTTRNPAPFRLQDIGLELIPEVITNARPYVDSTIPESVARRAGFRPDDLIVFINKTPVRTIKELRQTIDQIDRDDRVVFSVRRRNRLITIAVSRLDQNSKSKVDR